MSSMLSFQQIILRLQEFWDLQGCALDTAELVL
jgi:glycyl-tRNA synthetase alpha subunit